MSNKKQELLILREQLVTLPVIFKFLVRFVLFIILDFCAVCFLFVCYHSVSCLVEIAFIFHTLSPFVSIDLVVVTL